MSTQPETPSTSTTGNPGREFTIVGFRRPPREMGDRRRGSSDDLRDSAGCVGGN